MVGSAVHVSKQTNKRSECKMNVNYKNLHIGFSRRFNCMCCSCYEQRVGQNAKTVHDFERENKCITFNYWKWGVFLWISTVCKMQMSVNVKWDKDIIAHSPMQTSLVLQIIQRSYNRLLYYFIAILLPCSFSYLNNKILPKKKLNSVLILRLSFQLQLMLDVGVACCQSIVNYGTLYIIY